MNRNRFLAAALCFALILGGCGSQTPNPPAPEADATEAVTEQQAAETGESEETDAGSAEAGEPVSETEANETTPESAKVEGLNVSELRARLEKSSAAAGVAYLTYRLDEDPVPITTAAAVDSLAVTYPFLSEIPESRAVDMGGTELYLVVPAEDITEVGVYYYNEGDNDKIGDAVYQAADNEPILIVCNKYDQGPNTIVELKRGDEVALSYVPCLAATILQKAESVVDIGLAEDVYAFDGYAPLTVDGEALEMMLAVEGEGEEGEILGGPLLLTYKGQTLETESFVDYLQTSYVVDTEEGFYVLAQAGYEGDWTRTILVQYTPGKGLEKLDVKEGCVTDLSRLTLDAIEIEGRYDCLGTYGTYVEHGVKDGKLVPATTYLDFRNEYDPYFAAWASQEAEDNYTSEYYTTDGYRYLRTRASFQAAAEDGSAVTIPADAVILPRGAEEASGTFFFTWEGKTLSVVCEQNTDGYGWKIHGVPEEDIFVTLPYAG